MEKGTYFGDSQSLCVEMNTI